MNMSSELGVERPTTLPLPESQVERRVHFSDVSSACLVHNQQPRLSSTPSPRKSRADPDFRPKRKRSTSFSGPCEFRFGNKRRKRNRVLPSKFLLGGNITDPLNLGSLDKEEDAQGEALETAGSVVSKRSGAVRVIIPPNINDPLNLDASSDNEDTLTDAVQKQLRRRRRSRKRKRRLSEPTSMPSDSASFQAFGAEADQMEMQTLEAEQVTDTELPSAVSLDTVKPIITCIELTATQGATDGRKESVGPVTLSGTKASTSGMQRPVFKKQRSKSENKIVSPVIPQPGGERKRHPSHSKHYAEKPHLSQQNLQPPKKFNPKNELFQYGNYNKYYGYRNPDQTPDIRLEYLRREWFEGKEVLDIGCNIGHITLTIARDYNPKRAVGIDIDKKLVSIAEKNIKHYLCKGDIHEVHFPKSMRLLYGPLNPPARADGTRAFPYNVKFVHANYVLESDELLETVRPEFDIILCLSITKWVHLNWGDSGLKRFFRRIFYNLKPGGRLILEPQGWPSYNKRRKLTKRIFDNYKNIRLFPEKFNDYLLHEVGFSTSEKMTTPPHASRGFQRPIIVYTKAGGSNKASPAGEGRLKDSSTTKKVKDRVNVMVEQDKIKYACSGVSKNVRKDANVGNNLVKEIDLNKEHEIMAESSKVNKSVVKAVGDKDLPGATDKISKDTRIVMTPAEQRERHCKTLRRTVSLPEPIVSVPECQEIKVSQTVSRRQKDADSNREDNKHFCDTWVAKELQVGELGSYTTHSSGDTQSVGRINELPYSSNKNNKSKDSQSVLPYIIQSTIKSESCVSCNKISCTVLTTGLNKGENLESADKYDKVRTVLSSESVTEIDNCKCVSGKANVRQKPEDCISLNLIEKSCDSKIPAVQENIQGSSAISVEETVTVMPRVKSPQRNKFENDKNTCATSPLRHRFVSIDQEKAPKEPSKM